MENEQVSADYKRIKEVMAALNFFSDRKFAEAIGASPQNFYDLKSGRTKTISSFLVDRITERYPQFNAEYLISGTGDMIKSANVQTIQGNGNHHNTNGSSDARYIAHLEAEIAILRKEKEELWQLVQKLTK